MTVSSACLASAGYPVPKVRSAQRFQRGSLGYQEVTVMATANSIPKYDFHYPERDALPVSSVSSVK